jgi:hypothetical protein
LGLGLDWGVLLRILLGLGLLGWLDSSLDLRISNLGFLLEFGERANAI